MLTFILTLVICSQVPNNVPSYIKFPEISLLGTGKAYDYFVGGFVILVPQLLIVLLGRIQFLFQTQYLVNRGIILLIHGLALVSAVFLLIMAIVSVDDRPHLHVVGAFGMFGFLSFYCFLHTVVIIYLYCRRSDALHHSNIILPIWFSVCSLLIITFFLVWMFTGEAIPQYIAASTPFLYFLGFVPQFWVRARTRRRDSIKPGLLRFSSEVYA
jgi:hypothetical protein